MKNKNSALNEVFHNELFKLQDFFFTDDDGNFYELKTKIDYCSIQIEKKITIPIITIRIGIPWFLIRPQSFLLAH